MPLSSDKMLIGARSSPLSQAQLAELQALVDFELTPVLIETHGDHDRTTSLRTLDKTDFFTREIDQAQLDGTCRLSLHSAKDLADSLPKGLHIAAITQGVDASDSLVLRNGGSLRAGMTIATSSRRRESNVSKLQNGLKFVDIRGTIGERLSELDRGEVDGVVIAEAALIRLKLTHLHRITLPGTTTPLQGKLAVVCRAGDHEMIWRLSPLDIRPKRLSLYLGLEPSNPKAIHYPVIRIVPRTVELPQLDSITHLLFTSKTAVNLFFSQVDPQSVRDKRCIAVGTTTAAHLEKHSLKADIIADEESADGVVEAIDPHLFTNAHILWPHSSLSRQVIPDFLQVNQIAYTELVLYDTLPNTPYAPPSLDPIDEIVFTSPSTVDSFLKIFGQIPLDKRLRCQGPITLRYLQKWLPDHYDAHPTHKETKPCLATNSL